MFGSVKDKVGNQKTALNVWVEDEEEDHFKVCMREVKSFDAAHENIAVVSEDILMNDNTVAPFPHSQISSRKS